MTPLEAKSTKVMASAKVKVTPLEDKSTKVLTSAKVKVVQCPTCAQSGCLGMDSEDLLANNKLPLVHFNGLLCCVLNAITTSKHVYVPSNL